MTISVGNHRFRAVKAALARTSKGGEQLAILLQVVSEGDTPDPDDNKDITMYMHFTEMTMKRTIANLDKLGWTGTDLNDSFGADAPPTASTLPNVVDGNVFEEPDLDGGMRLRVRLGGGLAVKELLDAGAAADFANRMKGNILAMRQGRGGPKTASPAAPAKAASRVKL